jgi:hypothetical protein
MKLTQYNVFGWVFHKGSVEAGEKFYLESRHASSPDRMSAQTIYTKGRITGHKVNDPSFVAAERKAGFGNDLLPDPVPALNLIMTAQEESEWWCVSLPLNKSLPSVEYIRLTPNESMPVSSGDLIFICEGSANFSGNVVNGPTTVRVVNAAGLVSLDTPVYGMRLDKENIA